MSTPSNASMPGPRILVAEDNPVNLRVALRMLQKLGFEADAAENGLQAVEAASRGSYALVLMDCQMPELDGYEATARIRAREPAGQHLPIVAMTANALPRDRERCLAAGMDDYLTKPVTLDSLAEVVGRWMPPRQSQPADPIAAASTLPVADAEVLARLGDPAADGDPEFLAEVAGIFLDEAPIRLDAMRDALARGDAGAAAWTAHSLKSSCGSLGLRRMHALCDEIEAHGRAGELAPIAPLLGWLADELPRAEAALHDAMRLGR